MRCNNTSIKKQKLCRNEKLTIKDQLVERNENLVRSCKDCMYMIRTSRLDWCILLVNLYLNELSRFGFIVVCYVFEKSSRDT